MADDRATTGGGDGGRFVPTNPCLRGIMSLFCDEKTADVVFDVDSREKFHAHRLILRACAPALAEFCDGDTEDVTSVPITGVEPDIFRHLLCYVYGGTIPEEVLSKNCKDIINAADRFAIGNLKVEAEGYYVESTPITLDNFVENLQFSDTKKCALLKETVMDFLVRNETAALAKLSRKDAPQSESMLTDFLTASARKCKVSNEYDLETMAITKMRKILDQKMLDVDGTREMLISDIEKHWIPENSVVVDGAGAQAVNGLYLRSGSFDGVPKYTRKTIYQGREEEFTLFRCKLTDNTRRWYISIVPMGQNPGTIKDIDFYAAVSEEGVPPKGDVWMSLPNSGGILPAPTIREKK